MLKLHNTFTRQKEVFVPLEPGKVRLYVCGMTVYDYCHLGHARVMVVFDMIVRYLRHLGYEVTYVRNVTDIDDKIIHRAAENGEPIETLTGRFIDAMHEDERALGVLPPDLEPRATQSVPAMLALIGKLIERGHAYVGANGDVYYAVSTFPGYGKLSGKHPDELRAGERVEVNAAKRDPLDFVLWKAAKPGEPSWESPWGPGRPGWHIECSAMSMRCLGETFDIHGGGMDLQFPHHENEIAQSEGATGHPFVRYWLHNGFVRVDEEKMSKSLGNFFTVREVLKAYPRPGVIRLFILSSHYRSPLNYSSDQLDKAQTDLTTLYTALRGVTPTMPGAIGAEYRQRFKEAMDDDFNTPAALAVLFELAHELNRGKQTESASPLAGLLTELGSVLGLLQENPDDWLKGTLDGSKEGLTDEGIETLIQQRLEARKAKNWVEADRIRDQLNEAGVILEDTAAETTWRRG
jgi:cysteinyl-tRNA synthetase